MMAQGGLQREFLCKDLERLELLRAAERERLLMEHLPADFTRRHPVAALRRIAGKVYVASGAGVARPRPPLMPAPRPTAPDASPRH